MGARRRTARDRRRGAVALRQDLPRSRHGSGVGRRGDAARAGDTGLRDQPDPVTRRGSGRVRRSRAIHAVRVADGTQVALTRPPDGDSDSLPAWSPDGRQVAFVRTDGGSWPPKRLFVVPSGGGAARQVAREDAQASFSRFDLVRWTPDSRSLVYSDQLQGNDTDIYTVDPDGTRRRRLTDNDVNDAAPAFSPDGAGSPSCARWAGPTRSSSSCARTGAPRGASHVGRARTSRPRGRRTARRSSSFEARLEAPTSCYRSTRFGPTAPGSAGWRRRTTSTTALPGHRTVADHRREKGPATTKGAGDGRRAGRRPRGRARCAGHRRTR